MLQLLLAFSFVAMFLISPVAAATSQGLEWGVELDDTFPFEMTMVDGGNTTFDEGINMTVIEAPPTIDDPLTNWTDIGELNLTITYYNGSSIGLLAFLFLGIMTVGGQMAVPVGNYSHLAVLAMAESFWNENFTLIDNSLFWGFTYAETEDDIEVSLTVEFLKEDGFLSRYLIMMENTTSTEESGFTVIRLNLPVPTEPTGTGFDIVGFVTDNILYIGIGLGVILVLAVLCMRRK